MKRHLAILLACGAGSALAEPAARKAAEIEAMIASAAPEQTVVVPPGLYEGTVRITRPVVLDGSGLVTIDGLGATVVVEIAATPVTFRNFNVRGSGERIDIEPAGIRAETGPVFIEGNTVTDCLFGIDLKMSPGSVVRGNTVVGKDLDPERRGDGIRLWWSEGCTVEDNRVTGVRDMVFWYSEDLMVRGNTVTDSRYGLHFMYSHETELRDNNLRGNSVGVYLMYSNAIVVIENHIANNRGPSGYGIGLKDCDAITIQKNALLANRVGLYIDNSPSSVGSLGEVEQNFIAFNEVGLVATPNTHDNEVFQNAFVENEEQVGVHGRGTLHLNRFAREGSGNFWSDYAGYDRNGDGVGDIPYEPKSLFESLLAREPNLRFFVHSPAQQAVEFTARALPELRPDSKMNDPAPLAEMPNIPFASSDEVELPGDAMAWTSLLMVAGCGLFTFVIARDPHGRVVRPVTTKGGMP